MLVVSAILTGLLVISQQANEAIADEKVASAEPTCDHTLTVEIARSENSKKSRKGQFVISLFTDEKTFLKAPLATQFILANTQPLQVEFANLCSGAYALSGYHDQNSDGKLNTNFLGIPKEAAGFSNGARGRFGPAKFDQAKFEIMGESSAQLLPIGKIKKAK